MIYGKKAERPAPLAIGLGISALPFLIHSLAPLWAAAGASVAALWAWNKLV